MTAPPSRSRRSTRSRSEPRAGNVAVAPVFGLDLLNSCYIYPKALLSDVKTLQVEIARLPRNFGLANRKNQLKTYPAQSPFGELIVYQDRCEGAEIARAALPDPAKSANRQQFELPIAQLRDEHDLCFLFTGSPNGPLYAVESVRLSRS